MIYIVDGNSVMCHAVAIPVELINKGKVVKGIEKMVMEIRWNGNRYHVMEVASINSFIVIDVDTGQVDKLTLG